MAYRTCLAFWKTILAAAFAVALPTAALGQEAPPPANPQAEALNDQGKELYKNKDFQGAAARFREANAIQPDSRYFFNLCATLEKAGDLDGALEACDSVYQYGPTEDLKGKTGQRAASIRQSIRQRNAGQPGNPPGNPPGSGEPGNPPGNPPGNGPVGPGPGPGQPGFQQPTAEVVKAPGEYKWAFGGEFGPILAGDLADGADAGGMLRLYVDKTFGGKLGGRAFLGIGGMSANLGTDINGNDITGTLTIVEFGAAAFTNIKLGSNLWMTPMFGVLVAGLQPSASNGSVTASGDSIGTFGINVGLPISLALGGGKHVIYVNPLAFTYYLPSNDNSGFVDNSFDGGSTFMITFGYQLRLSEGEKLPGFVVLE